MAVNGRNARLGSSGEAQAVKYLKRAGYKILKRNFKNPFGEIDIIAERDGVTAFIEVKTRLSDLFGAPSEAVTEARKRRYISGARYYFCNREIDCTVRFDIIEIYNGSLNHIENAFYQA